MGRTSVDAGIAVDALALVDDRQGLSHRDGLLRAGSYTLLAADTSDGAVLSRSCTRPLVLAADGNGRRYRHEFKKMLRADLDALAAAMALCTVYGNDAVLEF